MPYTTFTSTLAGGTDYVIQLKGMTFFMLAWEKAKNWYQDYDVLSLVLLAGLTWVNQWNSKLWFLLLVNGASEWEKDHSLMLSLELYLDN